MVTRGGESLLSKGYGFANVEHEVRNTSQTKFRIGSITKQFTAMAILILQEEGKLAVDDLVSYHLSDIREIWNDIQLHHLLSHTSGIIHSWALPEFEKFMMVPATLEETVARFRNCPLSFEPGQGFQYSGTGYFILALVVEKVSGQRYGAFLKNRIFEPLGLKDTGEDEHPEILPNRASGYIENEDGTLGNAPYIHMPTMTGGGNLYSTVEDLSKWDRALVCKELISTSSYKAMYTPIKNDYAYGWVVAERSNRMEVRHGGSVPGMVSHILRYPEDEICVTLCKNGPPWRNVEQIVEDLAAIALGESQNLPAEK